jgi:antitoxin (DNA-binding transcriptional repressor) of toxin-antitoxin stability system
MNVPTATFSALLRTPAEVLHQLEDGGEVLLTRRGAAPVMLSSVTAMDQEKRGLQAMSQLIAASLDDDFAARMAERLTITFPWIEFLPPDQRVEFVGEFLRVGRACAELGHYDRLTVTINAWQATADAYADGVDPTGADLDYYDQPVHATKPTPR